VEDPELNNENAPLNGLLNLIKSLRGPDGCPWDKKQVPQSMVIYLIEEVYELADAVRSDRPDEICEELGDVLFHIFFLASLFQETGDFSIDDVARMITQKMIRRHPHVFGTEKINSSEDVVQNWQRIKSSEKKSAGKDSILDSVPSRLPSLLRAYMVADRASKAGFEADRNARVLEELETKLAQLKLAVSGRDEKSADRQIGDFLFSFANFARSVGIHPETALADSVRRFEARFRRVEEQISGSGRKLEDVFQSEIDRIWGKTKI
jgi:tetrapyrrole methylase family protein/MazG family protein